MTIWKIVLISGLTTTALLALVVVVAALAWPRLAGWPASEGVWSGAHGGHRGGGFGMHRSGDPCARLDEASVTAHAEFVTTWVEGSLDLDDAQRQLLEPVVAIAVESVGELRQLCDADHDDARAAVRLATRVAEVSHQGLARVDSAFAAFYDALEVDQRARLDGWVAHAHRRH